MSKKVNHNHQKKIAVINDVTGFGRCSLAVQLPIISKLKIQCCGVPTAILSNQTGFPSYFIDDYTDRFEAYTNEWKKIDLHFNAITSGFIGSAEQIQQIKEFIKAFRDKDTIVMVDPVMGDHGKMYSSYTEDMCHAMKHLVKYATIITPNLTEACMLADYPYHEGHWTYSELEELMKKLVELGPEKIVITGIQQGQFVANVCYVPSLTNYELHITRQIHVGCERNGTGDAFAAIIAADAVNGVPFVKSVQRASRFVKKCILTSMEMDIPNTDGVAFEEVLDSLHV